MIIPLEIIETHQLNSQGISGDTTSLYARFTIFRTAEKDIVDDKNYLVGG